MKLRLISTCSLAAAASVAALNPLAAAVENAKPISQPAPAYSKDLRTSSVEGEVVVSFTITKSGDVLNPVVVSSTNRLLEGPTLAAVRTWKYAPAMKDGVPVSVCAVQPVSFVISELHPVASERLVTANSKPASAAKNSPAAD